LGLGEKKAYYPSLTKRVVAAKNEPTTGDLLKTKKSSVS
jgi:hypothetical protein